MRRQRRGEATYLLAWRGAAIVGHAVILWHGCDDEQVRSLHPNCPEVNGLDVFPPTMRGNGIGTILIAEAERRVRRAGYRTIGLGVAHDNGAAARLYARLGYTGDVEYRDRYTCVDSLGTRHDFADPCTFLVKPLGPA